MLPRAGGNLGSCIPVLCYSPVPNMVWLSVFGSVSFAFQSGCWAMVVRVSVGLLGLYRSFFIGGG